MNTTLSPLEISELICTRISHDLIGNIGAVSNAVELLEEGDMEFLGDIRSILKTSSSVLSARLKFFRMVFGMSNANLEKLDAVSAATQEYLGTLGNAKYPLKLEMRLKTAEFSRIAMLFAMILADVMIRGGTVEIEEEKGVLAGGAFAGGSLSQEKVSALKMVLNGGVPENPAQYAPIFYLQECLKSTKFKLYVVEQNSFGLILK